MATAASVASFQYQLSVPAGWTVTAAGVGLVVKDTSGTTELVVASPTMSDAAGAVSAAVALTAVADTGGYLLSEVPDPTWLAAAGRAWPVVVDPTITIGPANPINDCWLSQATPTTSECTQGVFKVGYDGSHANRDLFQFVGLTSAVPYDADVLSASFHFDVTSASSSSAQQFSFGPVAAASNDNWWPSSGVSSATWNDSQTSPSAVAWTSPGGDFSAALDPTVPLSNATTGWQTAPLLTTTAQWVSFVTADGSSTGANAHFGMEMKQASESTAQVVQLYSSCALSSSEWPYLSVTFQPRVGDQADQDYQSWTLDDQETLQVNKANGDLKIDATDDAVGDVGLATKITRVYDNLYQAPGVPNLGLGWGVDLGGDVYLSPGDGIVVYQDGNTAAGFEETSAGSSTFTAPRGLDAVLVYHSASDTYTMTFNQSSEVLTFAQVGTGDGTYHLTGDTDRNGNTISYTGSGGTWTGITDTEGNTWTVNYNTSGYLSGFADPGSRTVAYGYDGATGEQHLTSYTDANSKVTRYGYTSGNLTKITTPAGMVVDIAYNSNRTVQTVTFENGATPSEWSFAYSPGQQLHPQAGSTTIVDPDGNSATAPDGNTTTVDYNPFDEATKTYDSAGEFVSNSWTSDAQVTAYQDQLLNTTTFNFDSSGGPTNGNLDNIVEPKLSSSDTAATTQFAYLGSLSHQASSMTNPAGTCTAYNYDGNGNLTGVQTDMTPSGTSPNQYCTYASATYSATYNGLNGASCGGGKGQVCTEASPNGGTTSYTYGAAGNLTKITPPTVTTGTQPQPTVITYYSNGLAQVDTVTDGNGHEVQYSYDNDGRVTQANYHVGYPCVAATCVSVAYTADGQIQSRTDPTGSYSYTYDAPDRLTTETSTDPTLCPSPVGYQYDLSSNLTAWTCNGATAATYSYNNNNLVTGTATGAGNCTAWPVVQPCIADTYVSNNDTRLASMTFPNGDVETFGYDPAGHTTSVVAKTSGGATLTDFGASYRSGTNDQDFVQTRTASINGATAVTTNYTYGNADRLTYAADSGGDTNTWNYGYDADGNINYKRIDGGTAQTFTYNQADEITGAATPAFPYPPTFDPAGNQTGDGTGTTYAYNTFNQLDSITPHGGTVETLAATGTTNTNLVTDGTTSLFDSTLLGVLGTSTSPSSYLKTLRDPTGRLVYLETSTASYNYLVDTQGNIAAIATSNGTLAGSYTYDPYGTVTNTLSGITATNPYRYNAGYTTTSGPTHYGNRYYTPTSGTWTQTDPNPATIAQPLQYDRYPYTGDNPVSQSDPSGQTIAPLNPVCSVYYYSDPTLAYEDGCYAVQPLSGSILGTDVNPELAAACGLVGAVAVTPGLPAVAPEALACAVYGGAAALAYAAGLIF